MARWTDLATWRGPTPNCGDGDQYPNEGDDRMREQRGLVIHIAEGYYEGTIAYQKNPASNVSSHFIVSDGAKGQGDDGDIAQLVDTDITAWTQRAGNGHWLSVECAGFTPHPLTAAQCESIAQVLARAHSEYGVPLQLASNPDGRGLGHHSMGCNWPGGAWGHCDCPGPAIIAQKPAILARAIEIVNGDNDMTPAQGYTQFFDHQVIAGILAMADPINIPAYTNGGQTWAATSRPNLLARAVLAAQGNLSADELAALSKAIADQVEAGLDIPTAAENADATADEVAQREAAADQARAAALNAAS